MSVTVSLSQLQERLPELLDRAVESGEACVVQRDGKDYAVLVSAREWKRRTMGKRLDALGPTHRLPADKQARTEELLDRNKQGGLARAERRELQSLLRACDAILLQRAKDMDGFV